MKWRASRISSSLITLSFRWIFLRTYHKFRTLRAEAKPFGWKCPNIYQECTKMFPTSLYLHYVFFRLPPWATAKSPTRQCLRGWPKRIQLRGTESHLRNTLHRKITARFTKWETDAVFGNLTVLIHTNRISCLATGDNSTHKTVWQHGCVILICDIKQSFYQDEDEDVSHISFPHLVFHEMI